MSTKRVKTVNRLCVLAFMILAAALTLLALQIHFDYLGTTAVTIDRRVSTDGTIYDLRDDDDDTVWLRKISPEGELLAHVKLRRLNRDEKEYSDFDILDFSGDTVWLWKTARSINDFRVSSVSILRCELCTGEAETVYTRNGQGDAMLFSPKIQNGFAYFGERSDGSVSVWRVPSDGGKAESYGTIESDFIKQIYVTPDGDLIGITRGSTLTLYTSDGEVLRDLYTPDMYGVIASDSMGMSGEIYLYTVGDSGNTLLRVDLDGSIKPVELPGGREMLSVTAAGESAWAGHDKDYTLIGSGGLAIYKLGVDPMQAPDAESALRLILDTETSLLLPAAIALAAALVLSLRHLFLRRKTPLMTKQILIAIPVVALGLYIINIEVMNDIENMSASNLRRELYLHAERVLSEADFSVIEDIDWDLPLEDENYLTLLRALDDDYSQPMQSFFDVDFDEWRSEGSYVNYWLFSVEGRQAKTVYCGSLPVGLPYEYAQIKDLNDEFDAAFEQDGAVSGVAFDEQGRKWDMLRCQIRNSEGEIIAFLDVSLSYAQTDYFLNNIKSVLTLRILALMLIIVLACLAVSFAATRKFVGFRQALIALREGEYSHRVRIRGNDEVSDIARIFNDMAERVEHSIGVISETNRSFSRFVPQELFSILGKKSVLDVNPGDSAEENCALLSFYTNAFEAHAGGNLFESLSRYYQKIMPAVYSAGGVVERYSENEMVALFQRQPSSALLAAGGVFDALGDLDIFAENRAVSCSAVIGYRSIRLGMIGHADRLSAAVVSSFIMKSRLIGKLAERLGCRILMTGEAFSRGGLPEGFGVRFIGNAVITGETHPLYEVFPGGSSSERLREAERFGRAVKLYYNSEFYEARNLFVEVIKRAPGDLVAREYLLLSDRLMHAPEEPRPLLSSRGE